MITETEARRRILDATPRGRVERVPLAVAQGRRAVEEVRATLDLPGFDNSAMDGYAVRAADATTGARLRVVGQQAAGPDLGLEIGPGEAVRLFTGAPLPRGADAVVMQEDTERTEGDGWVTLREAAALGEFVRRRGGDLCTGQRLLSPGDRLTAARIGVLASQGLTEILVPARPTVAIVTTGDELLPPDGGPPGPGQLFESNGALLTAVARHFGAEAVAAHAPDEPEALRATLADALKTADFLWIAGGVSVGERDYVKPCLEAEGCMTDFWRVKVKPGKPFLFAQAPSGARVFGLPGNPVSAFVTALLFAVPALEKWSGGDPQAGEPPLPRLRGRLQTPLANPGDRPHYLRSRYDHATGVFHLTGLQESHALGGLCGANALVRLAENERLEAGAEVVGYALEL